MPSRQFWLPQVASNPMTPEDRLDQAGWFWLRVVGAQVWVHRQGLGWSDEHAAQQWGLTGKTLRRLEYGEGWPSLRAVATAAHGMGRRLVLSEYEAPWPPMPWELPDQASPGLRDP
jgi:hypothetical protein